MPVITLVPYPEKGEDALKPESEPDHTLLLHLIGIHQEEFKADDPRFIKQLDLPWVDALARAHRWKLEVKQPKRFQVQYVEQYHCWGVKDTRSNSLPTLHPTEGAAIEAEEKRNRGAKS